MGELTQKVFKGAIWVTLERFATQFMEFVLGMVMARLLTPADYGTAALTSIFFVVAKSVADCGLGSSLIQKKDADELDFNSVFYVSLALAAVVYSIMFFCAPLIARFYNEPILTGVVRLSGLSIIFYAVNSVQNAELTRLMRFDLSFLISVIVCLTGAASGIALALAGWGVWAIVWSGAIAGLVGVLAKWVVIAWRPRLMFSGVRIKSLFSFGWKMAASDLIGNFGAQFSGMLIGKFYSKTDLAFVEKGNGLPMRALISIQSATSSVSFPALTKIQDDRVRFLNAMRRVAQCSVYLVFPVMTYIGVSAPLLIRVLFGEQWLPAVPYMRICCFTCAIWPFTGINHTALVAMGRSGIALVINVALQLFNLLVILIFLRYSVFVFVLAGAVMGGPLSLVLHLAPNRKYLGYRLRYVIQDLLPVATACLAMAVSQVPVPFVLRSLMPSGSDSGLWFAVLVLGIQFFIGIPVYVVMSWVLRINSMGEYFFILTDWMEVRFPNAVRHMAFLKTCFERRFPREQ